MSNSSPSIYALISMAWNGSLAGFLEGSKNASVELVRTQALFATWSFCENSWYSYLNASIAKRPALLGSGTTGTNLGFTSQICRSWLVSALDRIGVYRNHSLKMLDLFKMIAWNLVQEFCLHLDFLLKSTSAL